jgi:hypothetical protein
MIAEEQDIGRRIGGNDVLKSRRVTAVIGRYQM